MLCYLFGYMSSKVIPHTDIPLSHDIFLDSPIIDIMSCNIYLLLLCMLVFEINNNNL